MISYPCAKCERELEVDDQLAGHRVRCPHCDNVEVVPLRPVAGVARPAVGRTTNGPGSSAATLPATLTSEPNLPAPERELIRVHPVMIRARPVMGSLLVLFALGGLGLAIAATFAPGMASYRWAVWAGAGIALAAVCWLAVWKIKSMATTLVITSRRTILHRGLFSRASKELPHSQVVDIQITQSFPQRVLGVGTLGLDGGGTDDVEIVVHDMPDPVRLRTLVDEARGN
jgi:hypothetical protein